MGLIASLVSLLGLGVWIIGVVGDGSGLACFVVGLLLLMFAGYLMDSANQEQAEIEAKLNQEAEDKLQQVNNQTLQFLSEMNLSPETNFFRFFVDSNYSYLAFFDLEIPYFLYAHADGYKKLPLKCIIETVSEAKYVSNKTIERQGTVKRAVIGGALAGGVGAIVGGTTGDSIVNEDVTLVDSWMRIQTNEVQYRTFIVHTPNKETADDDVAIVKAIISKYGDSKNTPNLEPAMS
ncbi:hypothetical protein [Selenomonas ruminantium]|uniref:hypothetical protein n=1 Tax=Selenomonas ruminantium TaxID=971 RepID=UPI0026F31C97|nr:hypothetical protein [Selenomonas ruminantium]